MQALGRRCSVQQTPPALVLQLCQLPDLLQELQLAADCIRSSNSVLPMA